MPNMSIQRIFQPLALRHSAREMSRAESAQRYKKNSCSIHSIEADLLALIRRDMGEDSVLRDRDLPHAVEPALAEIGKSVVYGSIA
jgi:hypothetical protein